MSPAVALLALVLATPSQGQGGAAALSEAERLYGQGLLELATAEEASLRRARELGERAYAIFVRHGHHARAADAAELIASSFLDQGRQREARAVSERIFAAARASGDPLLEAKGLAFRASVESRANSLEEAFELAGRARQIYAAAADRAGLARVASLQGTLYNSVFQPRSALVFHKEALELAAPLRDPALEMPIRLYLGVTLFDLGERDAGLKRLSEALELAEAAPGPRTFILLAHLSHTHMRLREQEQAERYARHGLEFALRLGNPNWVHGSYVRLGRLALARGDDRAAEAFFRRMLDWKAKMGGGGGRPTARAHLGLGQVHEQRGELELALEQYEDAIRDLDGVLRRRSAEEDRLGVLRQHAEAYREASHVLVRLHFEEAVRDGEYARRAFLASERLRNRAFTEHLAAAREGARAAPPELDERLRAINRRLNELSSALAAGSAPADQRARLLEALERLELEQRGVRRQIARGPGQSAAEDDESWTVERVQALLPPGTAFLEYCGDDPWVVFVLTRDRFQLVRLDRAGGLEQRVPAYVDLLGQASSRGFGRFEVAAGAELYRDLVEPALTALPPRISHLLIATDGALQRLPFEALPTGRAGRFLIEDYSLSYLPAASSLPIVRSSNTKAWKKSLLAFADPVYSTREGASSKRSFIEGDDFVLGPLPHSRTEVQLVSGLMGDSDVFTGQEATEARLKATDLGAYRVVHFATHGIASASHPDRSALILSLGGPQEEDGFLQVREIHDLRLDAELVVLSACQTGQGSAAAGEGMQGLSRAFLLAGARSLVASLWKVEDEATSQLMVGFYRHLRQGLSTAESLRRAKIELIRKDRSHPREWAAFVLFGDGNGSVPVIRAAARESSYFAVAVLLAVGACSLMLWSRRKGSLRSGLPPSP